MTDKYPSLPEPAHRGPDGTGSYFDAFTSDQMRAYVDADRASRPAPATASEISDAEMRQAFERECVPPGLLDKNESGVYTTRSVQLEWRGWQVAYRAGARAILALRPAAADVPAVEQERVKCSKCGGSGKEAHWASYGHAPFQQFTDCIHCCGTGQERLATPPAKAPAQEHEAARHVKDWRSTTPMISIDFKQAAELLNMFGGEPTTITLMTGPGHSGSGVYAVYDADPDGAVYLGSTDEEAVPDAPAEAGSGQGGDVADAARHLLGLIGDGQVMSCTRDWLDSVDRLRASLAAPASQAAVTDNRYPYYELRFIMRVLSHAGGAPKEDWQTAYGMARAIFLKWHKDRLASQAAVSPRAGEDAGLLADAERYRWLRDHHTNGAVDDEIHVAIDSAVVPNCWAAIGPDLDAAIDAIRAARQSTPQGGK